MPRRSSGFCTRAASAAIAISPRRGDGMRSPPSAAMPRPNSVSASSMRTASASRPTRRSPPGGTSDPRRRATADAQIALALLCDTGRGVPSDPARAAALLEQAAERGHPRAHYHFALHLLDGKGIAGKPGHGGNAFAQGRARRLQTGDGRAGAAAWRRLRSGAMVAGGGQCRRPRGAICGGL